MAKAFSPTSKIALILAFIKREMIGDAIIVTRETIERIKEEVKGSRPEFVYDQLRILEERGFITRRKSSGGGFVITIPTPTETVDIPSVVGVEEASSAQQKKTPRRRKRASRRNNTTPVVSTEKPHGKTLDEEIESTEETMAFHREKLASLEVIRQKLLDARDALKER